MAMLRSHSSSVLVSEGDAVEPEEREAAPTAPTAAEEDEGEEDARRVLGRLRALRQRFARLMLEAARRAQMAVEELYTLERALLERATLETVPPTQDGARHGLPKAVREALRFTGAGPLRRSKAWRLEALRRAAFRLRMTVERAGLPRAEDSSDGAEGAEGAPAAPLANEAALVAALRARRARGI